MSYTDEQMRAFSQIAYADFTQAYDSLKAKTGKDSFTIRELKTEAVRLDPHAKVDMLYCVKDSEMDSWMDSWKIAAIHDTNPQNGFYGCIIDTGDGNATLAFRGSEGLNNPEGLVHDWMSADVGLLNSVQTRQHEEVERFLAKYQDQINSYDSISLTGHSLGGNLSDYATLVSHKYGFDDKITQSVSLDGPGFSNEFIELHKAEILRMKDKMTHVKWSWVGGLLFDLPGVEVREVTVSNEANHKDKEKDIGSLKGLLYKHDTKYLNIDENGNFIDGKRDGFAGFLDKLSDIIEMNPGILVLLPFSFTALSWLYGSKEGIEKFFSDIAGVLNTTYHNITDAFKNLFRRSADYFRVDTGRLSQDAGEIRGYINRVKGNVDEMFASVQALTGMWTGPANKAFTEKFASEKQMIEEYLNEIDRFVTRLENDSSAYSACENRALNMIASVSI